MSDKSLPALGGKSFEELRRTNQHGAEYWSARELQPLLGYTQWRRFEQAIERAMTSCETSGNNPEYHFAGAGKMVGLGSGSQREVDDYQLSRFACYLIAQNGDPRKPEIAQAQKYFAVQSRRQELSDQAAADMERLELRVIVFERYCCLFAQRLYELPGSLPRQSTFPECPAIYGVLRYRHRGGRRCIESLAVQHKRPRVDAGEMRLTLIVRAKFCANWKTHAFGYPITRRRTTRFLCG